MSAIYSDPARADEPTALPDTEVFYAGAGEVWEEGDEYEEDSPAGWYWWACFPGCMPDGDATGPFATEDEAVADAQANAGRYTASAVTARLAARPEPGQ